jgi:leader peptidase (prepilin peptidase)/N-methyltransferase
MALLIAIGLLFGAFVGSFLNVCIHRLPRNESVVSPPSRCYSCGTQVRWYDNLPVLGYLMLRGQCRWCGAGFSPRYLVLELLVSGLTALVLWWAFSSPAAPAPWLVMAGLPEVAARTIAGAVVLALGYAVLVAALIDLDHLIIPDEITKALQMAAPFLAVCCGAGLVHLDLLDPRPWLWHRSILGADLVVTPGPFLGWTLGAGIGALLLLLASLPLAKLIYSRYCPEDQRWSDADHRGFRVGVLWFIAASVPALAALALLVWLHPQQGSQWWLLLAVQGGIAVLGSLCGWLSLYVVGLLGTIVFRRNAMGFGDVKFLAPIGAFLGPVGILYVFFAAALIGTVVGIPMRFMRERREIPFGPYLALAMLLVLFWGDRLHHWLSATLLH